MRESSPPIVREQVLAWLKTNVPEHRIRHILRVEEMAIDLAQTHGLDAQKAAQAALMHDLAKFFKPDRLLNLARSAGLVLDPVDEAEPHLLHADVGAIVARQEFGVEDETILAAIRNHTLGEPGMDRISCVVFLADTLEPGRGETEDLLYLRSVCQTNLTEAVWRTADYTLQYLIQSRRLVHPRSILTRNWFMQATVAQRSSVPSEPLLLRVG